MSQDYASQLEDNATRDDYEEGKCAEQDEPRRVTPTFVTEFRKLEAWFRRATMEVLHSRKG